MHEFYSSHTRWNICELHWFLMDIIYLCCNMFYIHTVHLLLQKAIKRRRVTGTIFIDLKNTV